VRFSCAALHTGGNTVSIRNVSKGEICNRILFSWTVMSCRFVVVSWLSPKHLLILDIDQVKMKKQILAIASLGMIFGSGDGPGQALVR
jgi:hypothetical protein